MSDVKAKGNVKANMNVMKAKTDVDRVVTAIAQLTHEVARMNVLLAQVAETVVGCGDGSRGYVRTLEVKR